jgi:hypothetical protein
LFLKITSSVINAKLDYPNVVGYCSLPPSMAAMTGAKSCIAHLSAMVTSFRGDIDQM